MYQTTCRHPSVVELVLPTKYYDLQERNDHVLFYPKALGRRIHSRNVAKGRPCLLPIRRGQSGGLRGGQSGVTLVGWLGLGICRRNRVRTLIRRTLSSKCQTCISSSVPQTSLTSFYCYLRFINAKTKAQKIVQKSTMVDVRPSQHP